MKVLYDTCLFIDLLRAGERLALFQERGHIRYLSPVVIMELNAGISNPKQQLVLDRLYRPYSGAGRIPRLENEHFHLAGKVLAKLRGTLDARKVSHDVLIAIGAQSVGAHLFTSNRRDFERIGKHVPVKLEFV